MENGGMAEWLKAAVLKTVSGVTRSGVRIPLPPPEKKRVSGLAVGIETAVGLSARLSAINGGSREVTDLKNTVP
jgi:hypothetical protein